MRALRAARVFDGTAFLGPATVLIDGESIAGVESGHPDPPDGVEVTTYDGTLLPGLFDCHVHLVSTGLPGTLEAAGSAPDDQLDAEIRRSLADQAAGGVTTVRDLGDVRYRTLEARALPGLPRVVAAGPPITTPGGHCHFLGGEAQGVDGVRRAVAEHVERGVDVIKVMGSGGMITLGTDVLAAQFTPEEMRALVEAGHAAGLKVLAHAHAVAGVWQAVHAGVDGIEHFTCLGEDGITTLDELLDAIADAGIVVDPTFGVDASRLPPPELMPPNLRAMQERFGVGPGQLVEVRTPQMTRARERGVRIVTGTDAGAAPPKPHGGAWRAVVDLLACGYDAAGALATATSIAADVCGLADVTGSLRPGLAADLLVVDGDLASDLEALSRPVAVLVRGAQVS